MSQKSKDEQFADGMRDFNERIEKAQADGNSRLRDQLYQDQQRWIAKVQGNQPIIGGWSKGGQRTA